MSNEARAPRPATVTFVMLITWLVALLSIIGGLAFLLADAATLVDAGISKSTANTYGVIEIVLGIIIGLVAVGLGNGNNFSRFLVTVLMLMRVIGATWAAVVLFGETGFWFVILAGLLALLVLFMLWSDKASRFFATN